MIIPVMHCFDNNFVIPAAVSFYSMLKNANKEYFYKLYVLHSDITEENKIKLIEVVASFNNASLEFINMHDFFAAEWELFQKKSFSKEVMYKLFAPSLFPQHDKIIITDVDVVLCGDISEAYFAINDESSEYFAGIRQLIPLNTFLFD